MDDANRCEILQLQEELRSLQEAFLVVAEKKINSQHEQRLNDLLDFKPDVYAPELPQLPEKLLNAPVSEVDPNELRTELKKRMKLLEILASKVDCPISKVVDKL